MRESRSPQTCNDNIHIRPARKADIPAMMSVVNAAFVVEDFIEGTRTDEARLSAMMQKGEFLVAEDDSGQIVGSVYTECLGDHAYLGMLAIDPSKQGTGLGRRMAEAAEVHCRRRGGREMKITVLSPRSELLTFYGKLGYIEAGTETFHSSRALKEGVECHAIVMLKKL
jgi:predicted N-acetyltransferase YhbS